MLCPSCGTTIQPSQKFCTECGAALSSANALTVASPTFAPLPPPMVAPLSPTAAHDTPPAGTEIYDPTAALNVIEQTSPTGYEPSAWEVGATTEWVPGDTGEAPVASGSQPFQFTPMLGVSALAAVVAVATAILDFATTEVVSDVGTQAVTLKLNDFASNYTVGAVIAAVLLVVGAALGAAGRRVGAGLAGGAGLALAGMMGMAAGQAISFFDSTEVALLQSGGSFTLTTTQEVGFWLAVVAAVLGGVAFAISLTSAGYDGRPSLSPLLGVLGALATVAVVVGPLIPINDAGFGDNFSNTFIPPATLYLRLLVVVLIGIGGVVGFLSNRRWGLGLALGAISVGAWQWVTALTESGDIPLGIAGFLPRRPDAIEVPSATGGNFFPAIDDPFAPHIVTTIGVVLMLLAAAAGLMVASQQRDRR